MLSVTAYRNEAGIWVDPGDSVFDLNALPEQDQALPAIYLFSSTVSGDGPAYAMAEDGTVLGSHWCSHWGYMKHDLHDRADRKTAAEKHYPDGYRLIVLTEPGSLPPDEVIERNRKQGEEARATEAQS